MSAGNAQDKIQLKGVDAPERGQTYGKNTKAHQSSG
jgi:endonuclease YncB( thermonuclease family)